MFNFLDTPRHKRQATRRVNRVDELLLLGRRLSSRPLYFYGQEPASFRHATDDVRNSAGVRGDVAAIRLSDAGVLVLVAGDAAKTEEVEDLLLDVLFENGSLALNCCRIKTLCKNGNIKCFSKLMSVN